MAYTICDLDGNPKPLRLLMANAQDVVRVGETFTPYWWVCDPCNSPANRFEIEFRAGQNKPTGYPWYQVVTSDDSQDDVQAKINHYIKVIAARKAMEQARHEWETLNR